MNLSPEEDAMFLKWKQMEPKILDEYNYNNNILNTYVNKSGHRIVESRLKKDFYSRVIEVGAGTGEHLRYVKHNYNKYIITDINDSHLQKAREKYKNRVDIIIEHQDALKLDYSNDYFDRLISIYNLEHIPNPHEALLEWKRVVKPGGIISISIPAEGGIPWNLGRYFTTRRFFTKKGLNLDYIIAREHINACYRLVALINYYFKQKDVFWFPLNIASPHLSLIYNCNIINE